MSINLNNYNIIFSPRWGGSGDIAANIHSLIHCIERAKSCVSTESHFTDFIFFELLHFKVTISCLYPNVPIAKCTYSITQLKSISNPNTALILGGSFNINFLDTQDKHISHFLNDLDYYLFNHLYLIQLEEHILLLQSLIIFVWNIVTINFLLRYNRFQWSISDSDSILRFCTLPFMLQTFILS